MYSCIAMKVCAPLLFVAILMIVGTTCTDPDEMEKSIIKWTDECGIELDIPKDKMEEFHSMSEPPIDRIATCLIACILRKAEFLKDGALQGGLIDSYVDEEQDEEKIETIKRITKKCIEEASDKTNECEISGAFARCMIEEFNILESEE